MEDLSYLSDFASDVLPNEVAESEVASLAVALRRLACQIMLFLETDKDSILLFPLNLVY